MATLIRMAWRNVWRNKRRTLIAIVAIALGIAFLLFFDGLYGGSRQAIFGNAVRLQGGNVQIHAPGYAAKAKRLPLLALEDADRAVAAARAQPNVLAASRRINTSGMVSSREGTFPIVITSIEPEQEAAHSLVANNVASGRYLNRADEDMLLIGRELAERLEVGVQDRVTLVGRATHEQMRRRTMTIVGIYDIGLPEMEKRMVYTSLAEGQSLFDLRGQATEVVVSLASVGQETEIVEALRAALPHYEVDSWQALNPELEQALQMNEQVMGVFGLIVLFIAGIGILNLLLMAVYERTREIGLMAAMGLKQRQILRLFLYEGTLIGLIGVLAGCALSALVLGILGHYGIDWSSASELSDLTALMGERLYPHARLDHYVTRGASALIIAALASLYPAWRASRREPAESLHFV